MLRDDLDDIQITVVGELTDAHLDILADLLIDLYEAQQEDASTEAA